MSLGIAAERVSQGVFVGMSLRSGAKLKVGVERYLACATGL